MCLMKHSMTGRHLFTPPLLCEIPQRWIYFNPSQNQVVDVGDSDGGSGGSLNALSICYDPF